jgi:hypothetical protein
MSQACLAEHHMHSREISIKEWEALAFFGSEPVSRA